MLRRIAVVALALVAGPKVAEAQSGHVLPNFEVPTVIIEEEIDTEQDDALDLANVVLSATRGTTTIQQAPAIVTVITADDLANQGATSLEDALDTVPGYMKLGAIYNQFPYPVTRGILQSTMYLVDGVSMFDPMFNVASVWRIAPIETVKRIEFVTGPGGVLWGANSYLGVINAISKDASDVDGVEADVGFGHGNGDREYLRGYVMAGAEEVFGEDTSLFLHSSFETYIDAGYELPAVQFATLVPNPNSNSLYGPMSRAEPARSFLFNLNGKLELGDLELRFSAPFVERHLSLGFVGQVQRTSSPQDTLTNPDGSLACDQNNPPDPIYDPSDRCVDVDRRARDNALDWFDRYVVAEYGTRFAGGDAGVSATAYAVQFVRDFPQVGLLPGLSGLLEGGLGFTFDATSYRAGTAINADASLPSNLDIFYGAEAFHEWLPDQGDPRLSGRVGSFNGPYQVERLPLSCPRERSRDADGNFDGGVQLVARCPMTIAEATSRTVMGTYVNPRWRLTEKLTLDAGARAQIAPESLADTGYGLEPLFSGALVYGFAKNWHAKLNYAEGFRPPVFNNLVSNGEAVQIDGDPDLENERSQSAQVEVNARLLQGEKSIRELNFRADYSYSKLENLIQIVGGRYQNTADRGIHSAELLARLYVQGGHQFNLAYTWLRMDTADKGRNRVSPEHWFHLSSHVAISETLSASSALRVMGATEDPNRIVEHRSYAFDDEGRVVNTMTGAREELLVTPTELVLDRIPASADLTLGLTYASSNRLRVRVFTYNTFNARYFQPDGFGNYEPRLEFVPNPARDFRFQVHATYAY